jgi:carboxymethylenebutenolidase
MLLLHEAFGVNDHIEDVAKRFAAEGYVVAAPSLYHRLGVDTVPYHEHDRAVGLLSRLTTEDIVVDMTLAHGELVARADVDPDRVTAVGFCFGGRCSYLAASELDLAAAVSFYGVGIASPGPGNLLDRARSLRSPMLFLFGGDDPLIPAEARSALADALAPSDTLHEIVTYTDAGHAFFNDTRVDRHHAGAAAEAWKRTLAFLHRHASPSASMD